MVMGKSVMLGLMTFGLLSTPADAQSKACGDIAQGNGVVDIEDLLKLLGAYGSTNAAANIVGSDKIDIEDLLAVLGQYGSKCKRSSGAGKPGLVFEVSWPCFPTVESWYSSTGTLWALRVTPACLPGERRLTTGKASTSPTWARRS